MTKMVIPVLFFFLSTELSEYRFDEGRQPELRLKKSYTINEEAEGG